MLNINTREKKMIFLAILVIVGAVVYKYFAVPYMEKWKSMDDQIYQVQVRLDRAKQLKANPGSELYSENTIRNQTATIAALLENLESWGDQAGVKINTVKPGPVQDKPTSRELSFDVEVNGEIGNICKLVEAIEKPNTLARINKVRISKPKDILRDMTVVLTVSTLSLPEVTQVKKTSTTKETYDL